MEQPFAVINDRLALAAQVHAQPRQAPNHRGHQAVNQAHFRVQEEFGRLEQRQAGQQVFAQALARGIGRAAAGADHLHLGEPVPLDAHRRDANARARQRIDRHQRRMRIALVEVLADHRGVEQGEITIDQGGRGGVWIEIDQIFRRIGVIHDHAFIADALGGQHKPCPMTLNVVGGGVQRQYAARASAMNHARFLFPIDETTTAARGRGNRMMPIRV